MKKRSYNQYCSLARGLDIVGERWTLLLIRELLIGPRRFKDLLEGLEGIGTNLLAARLKEMESSNVIERTTLPPPSGSTVYQLTELGRELEPAVLSLVKWGFHFLDKKKPGELSRPEWDLVAMKAAFRPEKAKNLTESFEMDLDGVLFHIDVKKGTIGINLGAAVKPKAHIVTTGKVLAALGQGRLTFEEANQSGKLRVAGSVSAAKRMFRLFSMNKNIVS